MAIDKIHKKLKNIYMMNSEKYKMNIKPDEESHSWMVDQGPYP